MPRQIKMTRKAFMAVLAQHPGVTLDETSNPIALNLDSPAGKVFTANGCHNMVEYFSNNTQSWKTEAYAEVAARLKYGMHNCTDPECDTCHPEESNG